MSLWEKYLEQIYFDPKHPGSFQGVKTLYDVVKKEGKYKISHKQIKNWLESNKSYSTNKAVKRNFPRQQVIVSGIDAQFDADLANLTDYSEENDGYKYLLAVIDIFSRYAWVEPIKNKSSKEIVKAFDSIISQGRVPKVLRTDAAKDFTSKEFQKYLKEKNIHYFSTHSEKQANYVERFIKTIKSKIFRYITQANTPRYIDKLQDFVRSYNNTFHSGIKSEPINVNKNNEKELWWEMYSPKEKYNKNNKKRKFKVKFKFKVGDRVRISYLRSAFQREYSVKWSNEIFQIYRVEGSFNQAELQKVEKPSQDLFNIDKVIDYKGVGRNKTVRVHWKGWPKKFDTILPESHIEKI